MTLDDLKDEADHNFLSWSLVTITTASTTGLSQDVQRIGGCAPSVYIHRMKVIYNAAPRTHVGRIGLKGALGLAGTGRGGGQHPDMPFGMNRSRWPLQLVAQS
jgi:hypothetical protein